MAAISGLDLFIEGTRRAIVWSDSNEAKQTRILDFGPIAEGTELGKFDSGMLGCLFTP